MFFYIVPTNVKGLLHDVFLHFEVLGFNEFEKKYIVELDKTEKRIAALK